MAVLFFVGSPATARDDPTESSDKAKSFLPAEIGPHFLALTIARANT